MSNKMLIDSSHPEETRVAVMKGNQVEEFDLESQNRRQLRGNIYLAKVTRVEPSLQAAFVEYGGNRHGFLAFSEIHPDYYQIPLADRQELLREEAEAAAHEAEEDEARASRNARKGTADTAETEETDDADDDDTDAKPRRRRSRRSRRSSSAKRKADDNSDDDAEVETLTGDEATDDSLLDGIEVPDTDDVETDDDEDDDAPRTMAAENETESVSEAADGGSEEKPKRRRSRRKAPEATEGAPAEAAEAADEKPAPKRRSRRKPAAAEAADTAVKEPAAEEAPAKPKRRSRRKTEPTEEVAEAKTDEAVAETTGGSEEAPKPRRRSRRKTAEPAEAKETKAEDDAGKADASGADVPEDDGSEEKPARRSRRSRSRKTPAKTRDDNGSEKSDVDAVGSEDAMEEVPVRKAKRRHYKIQEVVKRRQIMLVQVVKEERGNKGAALTTYLSLAGRYSVLMPNTARGGGISRKITSAGDRKKLKEIASSLEVTEGMGVILRTAGADRTRTEITRDFEYLLRLWENVRTLTLESTAPCLVYEEGSLIKRSIRDLFDKDTKEIHVAGREGYEEARDFMEMLEPGQGKMVKFYSGRVPLFAKMGVEAQLDNMLQPQVTLKSGGYLVINQTEALVAIDVNSGKSTKQHSIEETAYQTNLEAADEVARQLRLRDLAGLIVIDFIDMDERRNNRNVEKRLKDALKDDRARIQVGRISHFGLMEMSRQRMRASVIESATETCPVCAGLGYVRTPSSVSIHVLRGIEEHLLRHSRNDVTVRTRLATAMEILNNKRSSLDDLESRFGVSITVEADETLGQTHFALTKGEPATARNASERHVQVDSIQRPDDDAEPAAESGSAVEETPGVSPDASEDGSKRRRRGRRGGRKSKSEEANAPENADESAAKAEPADEDAADEAVAEELQAEEKPAPRKRRRRKASPTAETEQPDDAGADESAPEAKAGPEAASEPEARPKRRATSRPKRKTPEEAVGEGAVHATSDAVLEGEPAEVLPEPEAIEEPRRAPRRRTGRVGKKSADGEAEGDVGDGEKEGGKKSWLKRTFFPD